MPLSRLLRPFFITIPCKFISVCAFVLNHMIHLVQINIYLSIIASSVNWNCSCNSDEHSAWEYLIDIVAIFLKRITTTNHFSCTGHLKMPIIILWLYKCSSKRKRMEGWLQWLHNFVLIIGFLTKINWGFLEFTSINLMHAKNHNATLYSHFDRMHHESHIFMVLSMMHSFAIYMEVNRRISNMQCDKVPYTMNLNPMWQVTWSIK